MRRLVLCVLLLLAIPSPAQAHAVGPGAGVELELVLVGAAAVVLGAIMLRAKGASRTPAWVVMGVGVALVGVGVVLPQLNDSTPPADISLAIESPKEGATVPSGKDVTVHVHISGATVATSPTDTGKGHLHLYVDDELQDMPYSTEPQVSLPPGEHEIRIEYVDPDHVAYDPPVEAAVTVTAKR